ncbi:hypothetical protein ES703_29507 [subsurface metagenome]
MWKLGPGPIFFDKKPVGLIYQAPAIYLFGGGTNFKLPKFDSPSQLSSRPGPGRHRSFSRELLCQIERNIHPFWSL